MPLISIIIVNYNTKEILKDCLKNLLNFKMDLEIIVIDNDSSDGSVEMINDEFSHEMFKQIILIESKNNGLAAGYNIGLDNATSEYLLFLGADAFPIEKDLDKILDYMDTHKKVGISTARLVTRSGENDLDCHRGFPTPWVALTHFSGLDKLFPKSKKFATYFMGWKDLDKPHEIDLCISHFMFVRRTVFNDVGKWDTDFFVYGEDVDFCWRAKNKGWKIMYLPMAEVLHYKGASIGIRDSTADISKATHKDKLKMYKASTKAMKLFYKKHLDQKYPKIVKWLIFFAIELITILRTTKTKLP